VKTVKLISVFVHSDFCSNDYNITLHVRRPKRSIIFLERILQYNHNAFDIDITNRSNKKYREIYLDDVVINNPKHATIYR
jgi:hypothetical protein